tara:strand:+ start:1194 stop:1373 length:180 start_codon:yes stop_codon:yes gene_type:complete
MNIVLNVFPKHIMQKILHSKTQKRISVIANKIIQYVLIPNFQKGMKKYATQNNKKRYIK